MSNIYKLFTYFSLFAIIVAPFAANYATPSMTSNVMVVAEVPLDTYPVPVRIKKFD